jgi:hypothetical protein
MLPKTRKNCFTAVLNHFNDKPTPIVHLLSMIIENHQGLRKLLSALMIERRQQYLLLRCVRRIFLRSGDNVTQEVFRRINLVDNIQQQYIERELEDYQLEFLETRQRALN